MRLETLAFLLIGSAIITLSTGCTGLMQGQREGSFTLITDSQGLQAWSDYQVGVQTEAKAYDQDKPSSYWRNRDSQIKSLVISKGGANHGK